LCSSIVRSITVSRIRREWGDDGEADALRLAEQRHKNEHGENRALQKNRNGQGAALHAALTRELFGIAVHQASG
jgi:hypothetical protein